MRRLALGLPTALQIDESYAILFHEKGVSELTVLVNNIRYRTLKPPPKCYSRRIWVLIDSNPHLPKPANIFTYTSPFFVVNAVSPCSPGVDWLDKVGHDTFFMNPWFDFEVIQAYVDLLS